MAKIRCEVSSCDFNNDGGCRLGRIKVDGESAIKASDTVCDSYTDRKEQGFVNCTPSDCACENAGIECEAEACKYNEHCTCTADRITIGTSKACCCSETACMTFHKE